MVLGDNSKCMKGICWIVLMLFEMVHGTSYIVAYQLHLLFNEFAKFHDLCLDRFGNISKMQYKYLKMKATILP